MKISIITPSYNQGRFIEDAIQSVLAQEYEHFEHIIVDACSTDDTLERLKKYTHLNWRSEPDEGQSDALNKGFMRASGDIIGWLNADDFYLPGTFKKVAAALADENIEGVYSNIKFCDKNGQIEGELKSHSPLKYLSLFHSYIPSESLFFKRTILDNGLKIDKSFHITMDKQFVANILFHNYKLKYMRDTFSVFRRHEANKSSDSQATRTTSDREGIRMINGILKTDIPLNTLTVKMYRAAIIGLLPLRKVLQLV